MPVACCAAARIKYSTFRCGGPTARKATLLLGVAVQEIAHRRQAW